MTGQERKAPKNVLDFLKESGGVVGKEKTLDEAVEELTDKLNCIECIASNECDHYYGMTKPGRGDDEADCKGKCKGLFKPRLYKA